MVKNLRITNHAIERMKSRGIRKDMFYDAINSGGEKYCIGKCMTIKCIYPQLTIKMDKTTKVVITVFWHCSVREARKTRHKYYGRKKNGQANQKAVH